MFIENLSSLFFQFPLYTNLSVAFALRIRLSYMLSKLLEIASKDFTLKIFQILRDVCPSVQIDGFGCIKYTRKCQNAIFAKVTLRGCWFSFFLCVPFRIGTSTEIRASPSVSSNSTLAGRKTLWLKNFNLAMQYWTAVLGFCVKRSLKAY